MKLDRNINANGLGKYALIKWRNYRAGDTAVDAALRTLDEAGMLDIGSTVDSEFMVIRLKDRGAARALRAYAEVFLRDDPEYFAEISEMAGRAGPNHPNCKNPD